MQGNVKPKQPVTVLRLAMKAVIVDGTGRVLILREATTYTDGTNTGRYHLPGGRVNMGEPFMEALMREVKEETGLDIEIGRPVYVGEWWPNIKGTQNQIVGVFFVCTAPENSVRLSEEHDDFRWIRPDETGEFDIMAPEPEAIAAAAAKA